MGDTGNPARCSPLQIVPSTDTLQQSGATAPISPKGSPMSREFSVVLERDEEGYYVASVPELPGCHTQARSLDELMDRVREAIALCLEVEGVPGQELEFVGIQRVTIAA